MYGAYLEDSNFPYFYKALTLLTSKSERGSTRIFELLCPILNFLPGSSAFPSVLIPRSKVQMPEGRA